MFRFEQPAYLYLLLLLPALVLLYFYAGYRRKKAIEKFGDPDLVADLMPTVSQLRPSLKFWLLFSAIGLFSFLLARPQFGTKLEEVERKGIEVIIALDISNSMLAEDVTPSRLERSKMLVSRLVDRLHNDKIGLILFAGDAFTQLPITSDYVSAKMFLSSIKPELIENQGTDIGKAVNLAMHSFTSQEEVGRTVIVITDGEDHEPGSIEAVQAAAKQGVQVNVMGVGSIDGAPIPIGYNEFLKDNQGNVVVTKLNEDMAQRIAQAGNGVYAHVDNTNRAHQAVIQEIDKLQKADISSKVFKDYDEQFQVFAWLILIILAGELFIINKRNSLFMKWQKFFKK